MAKLYCQVTGIVLLIAAVLGIAGFAIPGLVSLNDPGEIVLHIVLGAASSFVGFSKGGYGDWALRYAKVLGPFYLLLGLLGFVIPDLIPGFIHLDLGCNIGHVGLGAWGIWVGYFVTQAEAPGTAPA